MQTEYSVDRLSLAGQTYLLGIICYSISIGIGYLSCRMCRIGSNVKGVWIYSIVFPNQIFMGWPVMEAVYGKEILFYAAFANMANASFAYTFGIWLMRMTGSDKEKKTSLFKELLTPVNLAILAGLFLFFLQLKVPAPINSAIKGLADLTTPMAMIFTGTVLAMNPLLEIVSDTRVYLIALFRNLLIPSLVFVLLCSLPIPDLVFGTILLAHTMPVAGFAAVYAGAYGNDVRLASKFISISSLFSLVTIPVFVMLLR